MSSPQESPEPLDRLSTLDLDKIKAELDSSGKIDCPTPTCHETFKSIWGLKFHLKKNSCDSPKFKCDKCAGAFQSRILLQQHNCDLTQEDATDENIINNGNTKDILASGSNGDKEINVPTIDTNVRTESSENLSSNLEMSSPKRRQGRPQKQKDVLPIISKESPTDISSNSGELSVVKDKIQSCEEILVGREEICTTTTVDPIQTTKQIETSSDVQGDLNIKRKRGRRKKEVSGNVGSKDKESETPRPKKPPSTEETLTSPKRKRGRPRKTESPGDNTSEESRTRSDSSKLKKDSRTIVDVDSVQEERLNGNCNSAMPPSLQDFATLEKKRGRPPKAKNPRGRPRKITTDSPSNAEIGKRSSVRSASKKVNYAEKEHDDSDDSITDDDDDDDDDNYNGASKKPKLNASNGGDADDGDDDGGGNNVKTPKSTKKKEMNEKQKLMASLRKQLKTGKISCTNNCGKKFASIAGYNFHLEVCGKERTIIKCDVCGKEYTTQAGLKYHMNAIHPEPEEEKKENDEDKNEGTEEQEATTESPQDASKRPRRAASRAKQKFREIENEQKKIVLSSRKSSYGSRSSTLDQHIKKVRDDLITPALMRTVNDQLRKKKEIICANEGCQQTFNSSISFKNHYLRCGFDSAPFGCLLCGLGYNSLDGVRGHVEKFHGIDADEDSRKDSIASASESEDSDENQDSDFDYKKDTDEESNEEEEDDDDDNDVVEEDASEGGPSEDEDDEDDKKTMQWDKQRKRYKVEMIRKSSRKSDIMLFVGRWNKTFREFEKWRNENFSKKESFTEQTPTPVHWSRVQTSDVSSYVPTSTQSPHFRIVRPNINQHQNTSDTQLPVFTGLPKDDSGIHGDRIFYTGGPVWEVSWCPSPDGERNANQYLVTSSHKSFDTVHNAYEFHKDKGLLQLWNLGSLSNTSSSSGENPTLALAIAHDYGPVWKISWCPCGVWQPSPLTDNEDKNLSRLGLMALACGDGIVRVISVPHPDELLSRLDDLSNVEANETEPKSFINKVLVHCKPHMELYPCPINANYSGRRGQALCVDWSVVEPFDKVAAGFSDGTVVVWNLLTESPLLRKSTGNNQETLRLAPIVFIKAHSSLVRDLAFCPCNVDFVVTGGHDRSYKVWDLKSPISPMFIARKGFPYEVEWPFYTNGFLYCEDVIFHKDEPSVRLLNLAGVKPHPRVFLRFPSSTYTLTYNSWINVLGSADVGGNVTLGKMISSGQEKWHLYKTSLEDLAASSKTEDSTDKAASNLKEKSRSLMEETGTSRIVFEDKNALQFRFLVSKKNIEELDEKPNLVYCNCSTLQAVHKVRWNPNKQALTWIATGGASGLVRIHHVRQVEPHHLKSAS